jgi:hypothetical protein
MELANLVGEQELRCLLCSVRGEKRRSWDGESRVGPKLPPTSLSLLQYRVQERQEFSR